MIYVPKTIIPGIGLGELKFGITMDKVFQIIGEPERREKYSYSESNIDLTETWYYNALGFNVGFDEDENWKLILIAVKSEIYKLNQIFIGQTKNIVLSELYKLEIKDIEYEYMGTIENPTHELISSDTLGINFWFDDEKLSEIQISPIFIDNETIKWPE